MNEIRKDTGAGHATVFRYIQGVEILPEYKNAWLGKWGGSKKRMILAKKTAQIKANKAIPNLSPREKLIILSCLYWAEGNKNDFSFTNTDSVMIKVLVRTLEEIGILRNRLRITVRIYEDLDKQNCIKYWAKIVGVSGSQITNVNVIKGKKLGKLPYGMCRIRVAKAGDVLKYVTALRGRISEIVIGPNSSTDRTSPP